MSGMLSRLTATIANGASLSDALTLNGKQIAIIEMPAAWTAAVLSFQGSNDGTNYFNIFDDNGNEVIVFVDASQRIRVDLGSLSQHKYIKLRSGTSVTPVTQGAERIIYVEVWD
jgi:hypothetical protein